MPWGVPIIGQREFLSKVLIVGKTGGGTLELMQCLHRNAGPWEREDLSVDDSMEGSPVYFFDVRIPTVQVETEYGPFSLRLTVMGMEGPGYRWFAHTIRRTPELVLVSSGTDEEAWRAVEGLVEQLGDEKERALHLLVVEAGPGAGKPPFPDGLFRSTHRVRGLDDPACWNVIMAVAGDIARRSVSPTEQ